MKKLLRKLKLTYCFLRHRCPSCGERRTIYIDQFWGGGYPHFCMVERRYRK